MSNSKSQFTLLPSNEVSRKNLEILGCEEFWKCEECWLRALLCGE